MNKDLFTATQCAYDKENDRNNDHDDENADPDAGLKNTADDLAGAHRYNKSEKRQPCNFFHKKVVLLIK